jgi:hypothetical protein
MGADASLATTTVTVDGLAPTIQPGRFNRVGSRVRRSRPGLRRVPRAHTNQGHCKGRMAGQQDCRSASCVWCARIGIK